MTIPIVAVCSTKGGVGKSTITVGVASALEALGHHPLVVDCDPNGDSSVALGIDPMHETPAPGVYDALMGQSTDVQPVVIADAPGIQERTTAIRLLPGDERLLRDEIVTSYQGGLGLLLPRLANQHACDVVVIDLPTAPRPLINLGLFAASRVIHVLDAHLFAVKKTQALRQAIADAIAKGHPLPQHEAVVANKINTARRRDRQLLERLPEWFNCQAFTLRQEEAMARATQDGIPPLDMAPTGAGSDVLRRLAAWAIEPTQQQQSLSA